MPEKRQRPSMYFLKITIPHSGNPRRPPVSHSPAATQALLLCTSGRGCSVLPGLLLPQISGHLAPFHQFSTQMLSKRLPLIFIENCNLLALLYFSLYHISLPSIEGIYCILCFLLLQRKLHEDSDLKCFIQCIPSA